MLTSYSFIYCFGFASHIFGGLGLNLYFSHLLTYLRNSGTSQVWDVFVQTFLSYLVRSKVFVAFFLLRNFFLFSLLKP